MKNRSYVLFDGFKIPYVTKKLKRSFEIVIIKCRTLYNSTEVKQPIARLPVIFHKSMSVSNYFLLIIWRKSSLATPKSPNHLVQQCSIDPTLSDYKLTTQ